MTKLEPEYDDSASISGEEFRTEFTRVWSGIVEELQDPTVMDRTGLEWEGGVEGYLIRCRGIFRRVGVMRWGGEGRTGEEERMIVGKYSEYFEVTIVSRLLRKLTESRVMRWLSVDRELGVVSYLSGWVNKLVRWVKVVELIMGEVVSKESNKTSLCYQPHHNFYDWLAKLLQIQLQFHPTPPGRLYREFLRTGWYYSSQRVFQLLPPSERNLKSRLLKLFDSRVNPTRESPTTEPVTNQSKLFFDLLTKLRRFRIPEWLTLDESYVEEFLKETFITGLTQFPTEIDLLLVEDWFEYLAKPWLTKFMEGQYQTITPDQKLLVKNQVYNLTVKVYCEQRLPSLLRNLNNLPLSFPYFKDLKTCIEKLIVKPKLRSPQLQLQLNCQLSTTTTSQLLDFFTKAIYASSYLDSSGVFLEWLLTPLRESLPLRKDSCPLIVETMLFKNHYLSLPGYEYSLDHALHLAGFRSTLKLCKPITVPALSLDHSTLPIDDDEEELSWQPPPIDAGPIIFASLSHTNITTASLLVILYRDTDSIVKELHQAMANHLISSTDSDEDLLRWFDHKIQSFGFIDDRQRRRLHIMRCDLLRSLATSTRLSQELSGSDRPRTYRVIEGSKVAWPALPTDLGPLTLPSELQRPLDDYATKFHRAHPNLRLQFKPTRSLIRLRVSLPDQSHTELTVPFPTATVLFPFLSTPTWSVPGLTRELGGSSRTLLSHLRFWVGKGVLVQTDPITYRTWDAPPLPDRPPLQAPKRPFIVDDTSEASEPPSDPDETGPPPSPTLTEATLTAMYQKYSPWLHVLLNRSPTPLSLPHLYTHLNRYIMPPNSFHRTVPLPHFHTFLTWLVTTRRLHQDPTTKLYHPI